MGLLASFVIMTSHIKVVKPLPHHARREVCGTRPVYRQGRKSTAVKVFTINQESRYLLISNVNAVGASEDLKDACLEYGDIADFYAVDGYETEEFTETYLVKFERIQSARITKKKLDERSFFGAVLHVCYAPEFETVFETRHKIIDRCKYVAFKVGQRFTPVTARGRKRRPGAEGSSLLGEKRALIFPETPPVAYIWGGQEYAWAPPAPTNCGGLLPASSSPSYLDPLYNDQPLNFNSAPRDDSGKSDEPVPVAVEQQSNKPSSQQLAADAYERTISLIRDKVKEVAVPNADVLLRKRKP